MKTVQKAWDIDRLARLQQKINPKPQYQRAPVWPVKKKQLLIDSILRGYDLPKFYLRASKDTEFQYEVVDGQQRLTAIWEFCDNKFPLDEESESLPQGDLSGRTHDELPEPTQEVLGYFELSCVIVEDASEEEIRDLFKRLQEGMALNPAEKRNAMIGNMRDFCAELAGTHRVFPLTKITNKRNSWDDLAALVTCLELAGEPTDIKAPSLAKMYEDEKSFNQEGSKAKKIRKVLNYMERILKNEPPEMKIKWGFVDLYLLVSRLLDEYDIGGREPELENFFIGFEQQRLQVDDPADLAASGDFWDKDLFRYIENFSTGGGEKKNVQARHEVYLARALRDVADLTPKDPQRGFSKNQKIVIWRRDGGTCQMCNCTMTFEDMEADHIQAHSSGGLTTVENGQSLCLPCNRTKGAG